MLGAKKYICKYFVENSVVYTVWFRRTERGENIANITQIEVRNFMLCKNIPTLIFFFFVFLVVSESVSYFTYFSYV